MHRRDHSVEDRQVGLKPEARRGGGAREGRGRELCVLDVVMTKRAVITRRERS
jgi:hypothetical protein